MSEVWTAEKQKWWYEDAKGSVFTTVTRCRPCRRGEREREAAARAISEAGRGRKSQSSP